MSSRSPDDERWRRTDLEKPLATDRVTGSQRHMGFRGKDSFTDLKGRVNHSKNTLHKNKNTHKKIAYSYNDEDDYDEDNEGEHSVTGNGFQASRQGGASTSGNGSGPKMDNSNERAKINNRIIAKPIEDEDASSTSSCSCEDHMSTKDHEDDLHADLDYDEDSITGSPAGVADQNQTGSADHNSDNAKTEASDNIARSLGPNSMSNLESGFPKNLDGDEPYNEKSSPSSDQSQDRSYNSKPRIRSVINFDRGDDRDDSKNGLDHGSRHKSREDLASKSYDTLLKYFFKDTCYFQMKSVNHENIALSKSLGVWSTPPQNEQRLNSAFREHRNVILIFSVQQSGAFQGFARMTSVSRPSPEPIAWKLPERMNRNNLGGAFKVQWLCTKELSFNDTQDLFNPYNENKLVKVARDGQQVESKIGKRLCKRFPRDSRTKLVDSVLLLKQQTAQRKRSLGRRNFYPLDDRNLHPDERHYRQNIRPEVPMMRMNPHPLSDDSRIYGLASSGTRYDNCHLPARYRLPMRVRPNERGQYPPRRGAFHMNDYPPMRQYPMTRHPNLMYPGYPIPSNHLGPYHDPGYELPMDNPHPHFEGSFNEWGMEPDYAR